MTEPVRPGSARRILSPDRHLAAFDLENTLIASNVVESYAWLASRHLPAGERVAFVGRPAARGTGAARPRPARPRRLPALLLPPLRGGAGRPARATTAGSSSTTCCWPSRSRPASPGCAPTGPSGTAPSSSPVPSTSWSSRCGRCSTRSCAPARGGRDGRFTGRLDELPPIGEARALVLADYAEAEGLDLEESMAYADSASDLPLLEAVGLPGGRQPRGQAGRHRPAPGLARRALGQGGGRRPARPAPRAARPRGVAAGDAPARRPWPAGPSPARRPPRRGPDDEGPRLSNATCPGSPAAAGRLDRRLGPRRRASGRCACSTSTPRSCPAPTGTRCGRCCPASAARTWPRWTVAARATSRTWSASPSSPATRWSASSDDGSAATAPSTGRRALAPGTRVVIEPVLGCAPRRIDPVCAGARRVTPGACGHLAFGDLAPGLQTGFCADTGGGWSTAGAGGPRLPAPRRARRAVRRGRRHGRADGLRRARRPVRPASPTGDTGGRARGGHPRAHHRGRPPPTGRARHPCTVVVGAKYAHQRELAAALGADAVVAARPAGPGRARAGRGRWSLVGPADRRAPTSSSTAWAAPTRSPSRWPWCGHGGRVVLVGMPGRVVRRPRPAVAPRADPGRRLRLRHRDAPGPDAPERRTLRPGHRRGGARPGSVAWCRPATPSSASRRPWPTPGPPAGAARSRSSSTSATRKDARDEPQARIRPRRRPLHAAHPVLARRAVPAGAAARGQPGDLRARAPRRRSTIPGPPSATPSCTRSGTRSRCRRCCGRACG